jgi:hypothetical protein
MITDHWSNSKFADWIRGTVKPESASFPDWNDWKIEAMTAHPFRYAIAEDWLDKIQWVIWWPNNRVTSIVYYFRNRFITKTHTLTSSQLEKGRWHEFDTRLLYCVFDELVNFIEIELADHYIVWNNLEKEYNKSKGRSRQAGLDYLKWAQETKNYGTNDVSTQAIHAKEVEDLYNWWMFTRPAKLAHIEKLYDFDYVFGDNSPETEARFTQAVEFEDELESEGEEMLIRLIKVRGSLWT